MLNVANSLYLPQWGQTAGQNIRQNRLDAEAKQQQNMLAQALPMALNGDQNALAQVYAANPSVGYRIQSDMQEQKATAAKMKREQGEVNHGQFLDAAVGALGAVSQLPEAERESAWRAHEDELMRRFPDYVDQEPDTWEKAKSAAPRIAAVDKKYVDILGRYGLIPQQPAAPIGPTDDMREYAAAKQQGFPGTLQDWIIGQKKAGATNVNVPINTGQKGFDNELKIRGDFRSEPVYKAFQETENAYRQINTGLDAKSPAGDLAAATKFMKILDPTSVVRESELGMAMAATGALDRLSNYANRVVTGEKLTESQREDFRTLAGEFYQNAAEQYGAKRAEYQGIAKDFEMSPDRVTGPAPKMPAHKAVKITSDADYAAVPSGATYIAPDGSTRVKK